MLLKISFKETYLFIRCVHEVLVRPGETENCPVMTEKLLTETESTVEPQISHFVKYTPCEDLVESTKTSLLANVKYAYGQFR